MPTRAILKAVSVMLAVLRERDGSVSSERGASQPCGYTRMQVRVIMFAETKASQRSAFVMSRLSALRLFEQCLIEHYLIEQGLLLERMQPR